MEKEFAKRHNQGKLRYSLVNTFAHEQMVKVLNHGANKYGDNNWVKGFKWTDVIDSFERHWNAFKSGEDFDPETGEYHLAHAACNIHFLLAYYKIYPQGDNREHNYINQFRIALDIDEVLADFVGHYNNFFNSNIQPEFWNFDINIKEKLDRVKDNKEFWLTMPPKVNPSELGFEPVCYITARDIPSQWSEEWIASVGFPTMPVHTVGFDNSKVDICKKLNIDIFVDDRYENFQELNKNNICCFLFDAPHNRRYNVGFKRLYNLSDLIKK